MTYPEAIKFLEDLQLFGTKLGLENVLKLAELAGNPQRKLRFIHVAGTNGKGSTCAMLESIYRAAGLRVGLYTSPHLVAFGERFQVNRQPASRDDIVHLVNGIKPLLAQFPGDRHPTFFEVVTVMALRYFVEQQCDLVIWETGMGGRLDATNIVTPLASVITNIQFDHQAWLGDTLARIASEKAGIIKPGVPVITSVETPESFRVLFATARANNSPFWLITWTQTEFPPLRGLVLPLLGEHQRVNAALATYTVRALANQIPVTDETIQAGLSSVRWAGRLQLIERPGGQKVLLDGAHNTGGAEALRVALHTYFPAEVKTLVLGILRDKDCAALCGRLAPLAERILVAPVQSARSATTAELAAACRAANPTARIEEAASPADALARAADAPFVIVTGSLYLIGEVMEMLEFPSGKPDNEANLNEWHGTPRPPRNN